MTREAVVRLLKDGEMSEGNNYGASLYSDVAAIGFKQEYLEGMILKNQLLAAYSTRY